jgi:hypothetical protein
MLALTLKRAVCGKSSIEAWERYLQEDLGAMKTEMPNLPRSLACCAS